MIADDETFPYYMYKLTKLKTRICLKLEENRQLLMAFGSAIERELEDTCKITTVPRS